MGLWSCRRVWFCAPNQPYVYLFFVLSGSCCQLASCFLPAPAGFALSTLFYSALILFATSAFCLRSPKRLTVLSLRVFAPSACTWVAHIRTLIGFTSLCPVVPDPSGIGEFLFWDITSNICSCGSHNQKMFQPSCGSDGGDASKALVAEALFLSLLGKIRFG